jgi:hypothetical protein
MFNTARPAEQKVSKRMACSEPVRRVVRTYAGTKRELSPRESVPDFVDPVATKFAAELKAVFPF